MIGNLQSGYLMLRFDVGGEKHGEE
jgi:hypothetical protein